MIRVYVQVLQSQDESKGRSKLDEIKFIEACAAKSTLTAVLTRMETELDNFLQEEVVKLTALESHQSEFRIKSYDFFLKPDKL